MFNKIIREEAEPYPVGAEERQKKIDADIKEFLKKGGLIKQIAHDVFGDKSVMLTDRQKDINNGRKKKTKKKDLR